MTGPLHCASSTPGEEEDKEDKEEGEEDNLGNAPPDVDYKTVTDSLQNFIHDQGHCETHEGRNEEGKRQRGDAWKATDDVEIRGLIGILVFLGAQKQSKVNLTTIWEPLIGQDFVRATMSKNRCSQLLNT
ncbi:hypothetical protein PoB_001894000 [Plakobranchus ocellatus]|uniref:PiggyBac transposable element-derived protein domain-containing protein n=1 Tax=Plakobranchus ocellatus TaxID=259542 RepID=A0AAV3ZA80_9GAST|nr:hypothetical protein PoB_001894000 [Plakobranchus ocellatus]